MSSQGALNGSIGQHSVTNTPIAKLTQWNVNPNLAHVSEWGDSDSGGFTNRMAGRKDCKFSSEGKFSTASNVLNLFQPGDNVASILGVGQNNAYGWNFPYSLNLDFKMTVNLDTQEVVGWSADWGADGDYSLL